MRKANKGGRWKLRDEKQEKETRSERQEPENKSWEETNQEHV